MRTISAAFVAASVCGLTNAATITHVETTLISSGSNFNVSVFDGKAGYGGLASGTFGDGTVEAYAFFQNFEGNIGTGAVTPIVRYAEGNGSILSTPILTNTTTNGDLFGIANVFTTSDPGVGFAGTPNFAVGTGTITGGRVSSGTIDISGYASGEVYILAGAYQNTLPVVLTMTGDGQSTLTANNGTLVTAPNRNIYVFGFDFDNAGGFYDQISYSILNTGGNDNNRARYMGVVVDAVIVPEPSSVSLLAGSVIGTAILWRRRRGR